MEREEIATPNKIKKWDYLKSISIEITQEEDRNKNANCMKALEPLEIISSRNDGSYAIGQSWVGALLDPL